MNEIGDGHIAKFLEKEQWFAFVAKLFKDK